MINGIHDAAERFFALPEKQKMDLYIGNSQVCSTSSSQVHGNARTYTLRNSMATAL